MTQQHRVGILALQFHKAPIVQIVVDKKPRRPVESTLRWKSGNAGNAGWDAFCLPRGCRAFSARGAGYAELPTMLDRIDCSALPGSVKIAGNPLTGGGDDAATLSRRKIRHSPKPQMSGGRKFTSVSDSYLREVTLT